MKFDAQEIIANLAEQERVKGHHSPEGQAIRTLSRALNGWTGQILGAADVLALCDQASADWLKAKLKFSPWSAADLEKLLAHAAAEKLLTSIELAELRRTHDLHSRSAVQTIAEREIEAALAGAIAIIEKHWS